VQLNNLERSYLSNKHFDCFVTEQFWEGKYFTSSDNVDQQSLPSRLAGHLCSSLRRPIVASCRAPVLLSPSPPPSLVSARNLSLDRDRWLPSDGRLPSTSSSSRPRWTASPWSAALWSVHALAGRSCQTDVTPDVRLILRVADFFPRKASLPPSSVTCFLPFSP
jgi:hypothetical protein